MEWLIWLVVIAVFVVRALLKATNGSDGTGKARQTARQARQELRQQARQQGTGWQPPPPPRAWPPAPAVAGWFPAPMPQRQPTAEPLPMPGPTVEVVAQPVLEAHERVDDLRDAAREAARKAAPKTTEPVPSRPDVPTPTERYVGSAALESTLDSTIESSLFGSASGSLISSVLPGAAGPRLPVELEAQVRAYLDTGHEVAAVRLVCDALEVGILDALRAVRAVGGLPSP